MQIRGCREACHEDMDAFFRACMSFRKKGEKKRSLEKAEMVPDGKMFEDLEKELCRSDKMKINYKYSPFF